MASIARYQLFSIAVFLWLATFAWSLPGLDFFQLQKRTDPFFPSTPESCPICAKDYWSIQGCAEAAPVLQNFTNVIFNPGAFVDTIRCACADTFRAVFPQCVDCFIQTGQEDQIMGHQDLPAVVEGVRRVCAVASTLLGNVTETNNDPTKSSSGRQSIELANSIMALVLSALISVGLSSLSLS